jgi:DNA-binding transcriptional LysR family regulator
MIPSERLKVLNATRTFAQRITSPIRKIDIVEEGGDVAVRIGASEHWPDNLGHSCLGNGRVIIRAAPDYLDRCGTPADADPLRELHCILYGRRDSNTIKWRIARESGRVEERPMGSRIVL